jgi:choline dehydrogenase
MWPFSKPYPTTKVPNIDGHAYGYIIVGGGTGGYALAARLSADLSKTVLLLDRGDAIISWLSRVPLLTMDHRQSTAPSYRWTSLPSTLRDGLTEYMTSGKAFGGSSKINACIYHRLLPAEYDRWNEREWAWDVIEPVFI